MDDEYNGYIIPAGSIVIGNVWYVELFIPLTLFQTVPRQT